MKPLRIFSGIALLLLLVACATTKTTPELAGEVGRKILAKDFTIDAQYVSPMRGRQIFLNDNYDLRVKGDSAFAYLPYYGVAFVAPVNPTEGGIKFAEPMENYTVTPKKKNNGWDISFNVRHNEYYYTITLNIFDNGSTSFVVRSMQRDPITFSGSIKDLTLEK